MGVDNDPTGFSDQSSYSVRFYFKGSSWVGVNSGMRNAKNQQRVRSGIFLREN